MKGANRPKYGLELGLKSIFKPVASRVDNQYVDTLAEGLESYRAVTSSIRRDATPMTFAVPKH
jgi:hypothetical protein